MIDIRKDDVLHKSYLNRILIEVIDNPHLSQNLAFKGGTCASMLGYLDRFSVDLDFDLTGDANRQSIGDELRTVFSILGLELAKEFSKVLLFQVRYPSRPGRRNAVKISVNAATVRSNVYKAQNLPEIDRIFNCQTIETMFANKLVAVLDRHKLHSKIAGRDIYDIHYFFTHGYSYHVPVIEERMSMSRSEFFQKLSVFIKGNVTQKIVDEDLNTLLPPEKYRQIRKVLLPETLSLLENEIE